MSTKVKKRYERIRKEKKRKEKKRKEKKKTRRTCQVLGFLI
jgi:hypothetical protein